MQGQFGMFDGRPWLVPAVGTAVLLGAVLGALAIGFGVRRQRAAEAEVAPAVASEVAPPMETVTPPAPGIVTPTPHIAGAEYETVGVPSTPGSVIGASPMPSPPAAAPSTTSGGGTRRPPASFAPRTSSPTFAPPTTSTAKRPPTGAPTKLPAELPRSRD